jgi:hypothetical protein
VQVCGVERVLDKYATGVLKSLRPGEAVGRVSIVVTEEWPAYAFNYLPITGILVIMAAYHPGFYLPRRLIGVRLRAKRLLKEDEEKMRSATRKETPSQSSAGGGETAC